MATTEVYSNDLFMEVVRDHPCLYDKFAQGYRNTEVKARVWELIGKRFGFSGQVAETKYRSQRTKFTNYLKERKNIKSGMN